MGHLLRHLRAGVRRRVFGEVGFAPYAPVNDVNRRLCLKNATLSGTIRTFAFLSIVVYT